jgi:hypothetical protein
MASNAIKKLTILAGVTAMCGAGQTALAHTGIKDTVYEYNATTAGAITAADGNAFSTKSSTYSAFTLSHGCATNEIAEGSATDLSYDGNTTQKSVIAQSVLFPNAADSVFGKVDSNGYITDTSITIDQVISGATVGAVWPLSPSMVFPQPLPDSYVVRDSAGNTRGFQIWGGEIPEGGGTVALSSFKIATPKFAATSCAKSLKLQIAIANYCDTGSMKKDKLSDRADIWIGKMTTKFNDPLVMPNAATATNADGTAKIYWPTMTINRDLVNNPLPSGCDPVTGYDVAIQPSDADIDENLPMKLATKTHPKLPGKLFWPNTEKTSSSSHSDSSSHSNSNSSSHSSSSSSGHAH